MNEDQKSDLRANWILIGIISAGLILRLYNLGHKCFWEDEGVTWFFGQGIIHEDASPGLYFLLLHVFQSFFGGSEFAGRLLSALAGTAFIPLVFLLARRMFDQRTALISAFIVAISPYAISVSQEMRMYALLGVELALALYFFWIIFEKISDENTGVKWWLALFVVSIAGLYTHILFAFVFFFLTIVYLLVALKSSPRRLVHWALLMLIIGMTYIPELINMGERVSVRRHVLVQPTISALMSNVSQIYRSVATFGLGYYYKFLRVALPDLAEHNLDEVLSVLLAGLLIFCIIVAMIITLKRWSSIDERHKSSIRFLGYFVLYNVVLFLIVESTGAQKLMTLYIPIVLLLGLLLTHLNAIWRFCFLALLFISTALALAHYYPLEYFPYEEVDWREAGQFLTAKTASDDMIFFEGGRNGFYTIRYYYSGMTSTMRYINTKHWEPDPYQVDPLEWWARQPEAYIQDQLKHFPNIWYIDLAWKRDFNREFPHLRADSFWDFGQLLRIYLISRASL